ncbi:MAG: response regulator [Desulfobacter sp.]|nr:MAG: response regulator [Desulfobacter sp.]
MSGPKAEPSENREFVHQGSVWHKPRIMVLLLAVSIAGLGALFFSVYSQVSDRIRMDRQILMTETAGLLTARIDEWLDKNVRALRAASRQSGIISMDPAAQSGILNAVQREYPWIYLVFTLDEEGKNIARSDGGRLKDYSDREYFRRLKEGAPLSWQTLVGKTSKRPALVLALPIVKAGRFAGVIAAAMTRDAISGSVTARQMGNSGYAFLLDDQAKVIAHPDPQAVISEKTFDRHRLLELKDSDGLLAYEDEVGTPKIGVVRENRLGWHLILEQDCKEAFRELYRFQRFMVLVFGLMVVMVLVIAWLFARLSVSPVLRMISAGQRREEDLENQLQKVRKMEALGTFAGGIAHDFNNILGAITTCSELAIEDVDETNPAHEDLKHILKAAIRGKKLVKQILEYSRSRNTRHKPVKLHRIILECLDLFKSFKPAEIEVKLNIASKLDFILADPTQLHQVIMNLLLNAEHAMAGRAGILSIELTREDEAPDREGRAVELPQGPYLHLAVSDTGCGMDEHVLERMFDPFYTTHMNTGGTGLGLAMSDAIIRRHKGLITAESRISKGSTFHIYLPCIGHDDVLEEEDKDEPVAAGGDEKILFVDDDEHMVYSSSRMLRRLGYRVTTAENAMKALALFKENPGRFDLVITDRVMPGRNGVELAHDIRQIRPDIPIILCSGFFNKKDDEFLDTDYDIDGLIDETVSKPFEIKPMSMLIREVLDRRTNE